MSAKDLALTIALAGGGDNTEKITQAVTDWLDENVVQETGYVIDKTLLVEDAAADAKATGKTISLLKNAYDSFIEGEVFQRDILTSAALEKGNYAVNDNIATPTATNYRKAYTKGFSLEGNPTFVVDTNGAYNIAFAAFDETGKCISIATSWLTDGTYTAAQIKSNAQSASGAIYSFQIKSVNGGDISGITVKSSDYYQLIKADQQQIGTESIKNDSVTEDKLSPEVRQKIGTNAQKELLIDSNLIAGAYATGDAIDAPSTGSNSRAAYKYGFALTDDLVFVADTNGAYNIAFVAFDEDDLCISTPTAWLTDGTYSAAAIMANARSSAGAKYTFQISVAGGGNVPVPISTLDYYSLKSTGEITNVDVIMFMGQSNMAGRGETANAPTIIPGAGYEYRAISAPNILTPMVEPFGATESKQGGIDEGSAKTGSMAVAFSNAYYLHNGNVPVVGISASKGGTPISDWQPSGDYLTDAIDRLDKCITYLTSREYTIRHKYILWCQGETDGDNSTTAATYKTLFDTMLDEMKDQGIEKLFMVRIGNYNSGTSTKYEEIMDCQTEIAQTEPDVIMASTDFAGMRARNLMKDTWHYYQAAYNEVGQYAGENVAFYAITGKEPTMYDPQDGSLYFTHKN